MECGCPIHVTGIVVWFCDPLSSHLISYQPLGQKINVPLFAISNFIRSFSCNFSRQRRSVPSVRRVCKSFCRRFDNPNREVCLGIPEPSKWLTSKNAGSLWQVQKVFCSCTQDMSKTQKKLVTHKSSTSSCFIHCLYDSFGHEMRGTTARIRSSEKQSSGWDCSKNLHVVEHSEMERIQIPG